AGVRGTSQSGDGVFGTSASGNGVFGTSHGTSEAVVGKSLGVGAGVLGFSVGGGSGGIAKGKIALDVEGPAMFSRSGVLSVPAGPASVTKTGITFTPVSFVLATIQGNVAGTYVQGVTLATGSAGSFTIHLNKKASRGIKVAWFAVN